MTMNTNVETVLRINPHDMGSARDAGAQITQILASQDEGALLQSLSEMSFLAVVGERAEEIWRLLVSDGVPVEVAEDTARSFEMAALDERTRILRAMAKGAGDSSSRTLQA